MNNDTIYISKTEIVKKYFKNEHKSINRLIEYGFLKEYIINEKKYLLIAEFQYYLKALNNWNKYFKKYRELILELYILEQENFNIENFLKDYTELKYEDLKLLLWYYNIERKKKLRNIQIISKYDYFLIGEEILARLRIKDKDILLELFKNNAFETKIIHKNIFQSINISVKESFFLFLKKNELYGKRCYNSTDIKNLLEIKFKIKTTIEKIDRICLNFKIGKKLINSKNGNYIFTFNDFISIKEKLEKN